MNLIRKGHRHSHRGVIGIESAIVLIAFVIVAAALAFVVLNMGFATTQKAKTSIVATLGEAGSSLSVSGKVIGYSAPANNDVSVIGIPIKIASGGESVNLDVAFTAVKVVTETASHDNVYTGPLGLPGGELSLDNGITCAPDPIPGPAYAAPTEAQIYHTVDLNGNNILDQGEHAMLAVCFSAGDAPAALEKVKIELIPSAGAALTVERQIPNLSTDYVDLG